VAEPWLVAGLGNPGEEYARTRHNLGVMVVDRLCERLGVRLRKVRFVPAMAAEASYDGVPLVASVASSFMNESGPPIASLARKRGIPAERVVVVHDEIDLAFGALRVKLGGSTAGHHGLNSVVAAFRTPDFYRVRIGVGRPPGRQDPVKFVLSQFAARERDDVAIMIEDAADAVLSLVTEGLSVTQGRYNRPGIRGSEGQSEGQSKG
jgi:PTH1 family peptidyl-tRNA hydrolase